MLAETLRHAFDDLHAASVDLGVFRHNRAALHLYESLGFRVEEVLEDVEEMDGERWTALQMRLPAPSTDTTTNTHAGTTTNTNTTTNLTSTDPRTSTPRPGPAAPTTG